MKGLIIIKQNKSILEVEEENLYHKLKFSYSEHYFSKALERLHLMLIIKY
jgi:hypothetical protein